MNGSDDRLDAFRAAVDLLDRLNQNHARQASEFTIATVEECRRLLKKRSESGSASEDTPAAGAGELGELADLARNLLNENGFEGTLSMLAQICGSEFDIGALIDLVGRQAYLRALKREAEVFIQNNISFEQIARLWDEVGRPPLGDQRWTARGVSAVV